MPSKMIQTAITVCISSTRQNKNLTASNLTYTCTMNFLQLVIARKLISTLTQIKASIHNTVDIDTVNLFTLQHLLLQQIYSFLRGSVDLGQGLESF